MNLLVWNRTVLLGSALVIVSSAAILGGAAWNRQGGGNIGLNLSERELALPEFRDAEDSSIALSLMLTSQPPHVLQRAAWARNHVLKPIDYPWLDRTKLGELGFRVDLDPSDPSAAEHYAWSQARHVYVALELDGPSFRAWLASREESVARLRQGVADGSASRQELADAEAVLELDRVMRSRLFPIGASLDGAALRASYPDTARQLVLPAVAELRWTASSEGAAPALKGTLSIPEMPDVTVPREWHSIVNSLLPPASTQRRDRDRLGMRAEWPSAIPPRYLAIAHFGRRFEPWLERISAPATEP